MTMIASKAGDVSLSVSSKKGLDTSTRTLHAASLGVMVMHAALLISDDLLVKHRVLQHERECQQKKEEKERGIAASLEEEEVLGDHKKGRTKNLKNRCKSKPSSSFSLNEAHSHEYSGQEAVFQAAKCVSQAMDEAQDSMMKETLREIQAMKYILQHLEELEEFISQLRNKLDQWTQDLKNEGKFNALLALLKEHFKNDPQMLKKLNSLNLGDALAKQSEWDGRADVTKFFDNMFGIDQDKEHALTNFMNCVGKMCMESEKRGLGTQPLLLAVTRNEEKDFKKVIKKAISQVNQLLAILVLLEGGTKGKGFSHNQEEIFKAMALVMGVMEMLIQNNAKKSQQQIEISRLNVAIQTHNYEAAKKALQKIQESENQHGLWGLICSFFKSLIEGTKALFTDIQNGQSQDFARRLGTLFGGIFVSVTIKLVQGISQGKSFEEILEGVVTQGFMGSMGGLLEGTSFEKDLTNGVKLFVDTMLALDSIIAYGLSGASESKILEFSKSHAEAIVQNPEMHVVLDIATVVVIAAAALAQQYWLAGILLVVLVMNQTDSDGNSLMSALTTKALAPMFEAMGCSKEVAKVVADVFVLLVVLVATAGMGGFSAAAEEGGNIAATEGAELAESAAEEVGTELAESAAEEAGTELAEESTNVANDGSDGIKSIVRKALSKLKSGYKIVSQSIGPKVGVGLLEGSTVLGSANFAYDFSKAVAKNDKDLQQKLEILMQVILVITGVFGGVGLSSAVDTSALFKNWFSKLGKFMEENGTKFLGIAQEFQAGGFIGQGYAEIGLGGNKMLLGEWQGWLSKIRGSTALADSMEKMSEQQIRADQESCKEITNEQKQIVRNMSAPSSAMIGEARVLEQLA